MKLVSPIQTVKELQTLKTARKTLFIIGIFSSLFYLCTDILAVLQWEGYSFSSQSVSELSSIGSPTRSFVVSLFILYNILVIVFGYGICITDNRKRFQRLTGILIIGYAIVGIVTQLFFPMHMRGTEKTISDTMHIVFTGIEVLFILLSVGFGSTLYRRWFRIYSIGTILILLLFGILAGADGPNVAAQLPTPWLGIKERINIYGYLLWVMFLAIIFLRSENNRDSKSHNDA
jgi:heme/copper-type cytochrome/quinol oxidase subunit 4